MQGARWHKRIGTTKRSTNAPSDVNSSQEHQLNPVALLSHGLGSAVCHAYASPGALQVSGGLRHSGGDAGCQIREKKRRLCSLALWNVKHEDDQSVQINTEVTNDVLSSGCGAIKRIAGKVRCYGNKLRTPLTSPTSAIATSTISMK